MDWTVIEDVYLAITRVFDGFITFLMRVFGVAE